MVSGFSSIDHLHMVHALRLAERGAYTTKPNPMVGCVIAQGEEIVAEGFHQRAGEAAHTVAQEFEFVVVFAGHVSGYSVRSRFTPQKSWIAWPRTE